MRDLRRTSFTELSTLADCEQKWWLRYGEHRDSGQTVAMRRGSDIHECVSDWWWEPDRPMDDVIADHDWSGVEAEDVDTTIWLLRRYEQAHTHLRAEANLKIVGREVKFSQVLPSTGVEVVAYIDELALDGEGGLWIVERKTMRDWRRLNRLHVDPQLTLYVWVVRESGLPVRGVIFDAIRTYRWQPEKPTLAQIEEQITAEGSVYATKKALREEAKRRQEAHPGVDRPLEDSFAVHYLDRTDTQIDEALADAASAVQRRALLATGVRPIRNIGSGCDMCSHRAECWDSLSFGTVEDDDLMMSVY
jgi:hypothetical protein